MRFPKIRLWTLMGLVALVALLLWLVECTQMSLGTGFTNLKITFVVIDAMTSRPIDGATIEFQEEDFPADPVVDRMTDPAGKFIREDKTNVASRSTCWKTTYATRPPDIGFRTSAPGYETTPWMRLASPEHYAPLKSNHPVSTLDIKIRLSRSPSVPTKSAERLHP